MIYRGSTVQVRPEGVRLNRWPFENLVMVKVTEVAYLDDAKRHIRRPKLLNWQWCDDDIL